MVVFRRRVLFRRLVLFGLGCCWLLVGCSLITRLIARPALAVVHRDRIGPVSAFGPEPAQRCLVMLTVTPAPQVTVRLWVSMSKSLML